MAEETDVDKKDELGMIGKTKSSHSEPSSHVHCSIQNIRHYGYPDFQGYTESFIIIMGN